VRSARTFLEGEHRAVIYLSAEYLMGPQLGHNLLNLGIEQPVRDAMEELGLDLDELIEHEEEPGLGNGGLGRLAACFMDSLATLDMPAVGHGIRYEFGIFDQEIRDGWQVEKTDMWLRPGFPWEIRRYGIEHVVGFGGRTEHAVDDKGIPRARWIPERVVKGVPFDTPVLGYATGNANFLRLWRAEADQEETARQFLKIAGDELPQPGGDQDERPPLADEIAEVHPSHLVEQKEHAEQDEDESPENSS
jgi:starch phosphorylase